MWTESGAPDKACVVSNWPFGVSFVQGRDGLHACSGQRSIQIRRRSRRTSWSWGCAPCQGFSRRRVVNVRTDRLYPCTEVMITGNQMRSVALNLKPDLKRSLGSVFKDLGAAEIFLAGFRQYTSMDR